MFLIGDSIGKGYDKYTKDTLKGSAEMICSDENGRFSEYVYRQQSMFREWHNSDENFDMIH